MLSHSQRTSPGRAALTLAALMLLCLALLGGSLRSDAQRLRAARVAVVSRAPRVAVVSRAPRVAVVSHAGRLHRAARVMAAAHAVTSTIFHNFAPTTDGNAPGRGLIEGPDGTLYGVTTQPTTTVFKIATDGTFTVLHTFGGYADGFNPDAKLLLVGNQLFGTCTDGGGDDSAGGTVFAIDLTQVSPTNNAAGYAVLHYFGETEVADPNFVATLTADPSDGISSKAGLCLGTDGYLYGTTLLGGVHGKGTVYRLTPNSSGQFTATPKNSPEGYYLSQCGYTKLYDFSGSSIDGGNPESGLIQLSDGALYGTTQQGGNPTSGGGGAVQGATGFGTVYKINTNGFGFTLLHAFTGGLVVSGGAVTGTGDGSNPESELIQAADGNLYGTTYYGGPDNTGTVFQIKPDPQLGGFTTNSPFGTIAAPNSNSDGQEFAGGVIQGTDGNLYGTTLTGGAGGTGNGSVFQIKPDPSTGTFDAVADPLVVQQTTPDPYTTIYTFLGQYAPGGPDSALVQGADGRLYGESVAGGQLANGTGAGGTVFAINAGLPAPVAPLLVTSVTGAVAPPEVTTADTTLTVHGQNFNGSDTVTVDGVHASVTGYNLHTAADEQITVALAPPLSAGAHSVTVADAAPLTRVSSPLTFQVTLVSPQVLQVTNGVGGSVTTVDTTLKIHGTSFAAGDVVSIGTAGTSFSVTLNSGTLLTATLAQPLPGGDHAITVTHAAPFSGPPSNTYILTVLVGADPVIASVTGVGGGPVNANSTTLVIHGTGFDTTDGATVTGAGLPAGESVTNGAFNLTNPADEQITVTLALPLPTGTFNAGDTKADGRQSGPFAFTVAAAPAPVISGVTYLVSGQQLTITGSNFAPGATVGVLTSDGAVGPLAPTSNSGTSLSVTLPQPLPAGIGVVSVTNPDGQQATAALYVLAVTSVSYNSTTLTATVHGAGIAPQATVGIYDDDDARDITDDIITTGGLGLLDVSAAGDTITLPLHYALPGHSTFTVTNPDGQTGSADLYLPQINTVQYTVTLGGSRITVNGFGLSPGATVTIDGVPATTTGTSGTTQITVTTGAPLSAGTHTVTVRNADGTTTTFTLTVSPPPTISPGGVTFVTRPDTGNTVLYITGKNVAFSPPANTYPNFNVGATIDGTFELAGYWVNATNSNGEIVSQMRVPLGKVFGQGPHTVYVTNPDGQRSDGVVGTSLRTGKVVTAATGQIYNQDQTSYTVTAQPTNPFWQFIVDLFTGHLHFGTAPTSNTASTAPARVTLSGVDAITNTTPPVLVATHGGGSTTGVISNDGGSLIAQDGNGVISNDGGSLIGEDGSSLIGEDGSSLVSGSHGTVVSNDGGSVVSNDGGSIVAQGGGNIVAQGGGNIVAQGGGNVVSNDGGSIVAQGGGNLRAAGGSLLPAANPHATANAVTVFNLIGTVDNTDPNVNSLDFQIPSASGAARPRVQTGAAAPQPASFSFTRTDQTGHGTGSTDFTASAQNSAGKTIVLLQMRFTPGQPDVVLYLAPGLTLTPTNGTPPPTVDDNASPLPTHALLNTFPAGLQMIAVPENYSTVPLASAWDAPAGQVVDTWNGGATYQTGTALPAPGQGAWVHRAFPADLFDVAPAQTTTLSIPLRAGWNLIGDPFPAAVLGTNLTVTDSAGRSHTLAQANQKGIVYTTLYTYPAGATAYQAVGLLSGSLSPYTGYWLYAFQPCTLTVPPPF